MRWVFEFHRLDYAREPCSWQPSSIPQHVMWEPRWRAEGCHELYSLLLLIWWNSETRFILCSKGYNGWGEFAGLTRANAFICFPGHSWTSSRSPAPAKTLLREHLDGDGPIPYAATEIIGWWNHEYYFIRQYVHLNHVDVFGSKIQVRVVNNGRITAWV